MMSICFLTPVLRRASTITATRFIPSRLDNIEGVEGYQHGGYHPISIGDVFDLEHYRVLHKLGSRASFTVWLARDQREGKIVTLKAMSAAFSSMSPSEMPELSITQKFRQSLPSSVSANI